MASVRLDNGRCVPEVRAHVEFGNENQTGWALSQNLPRLTAPLAVGEFRALWFAEAQSVAGDQLAKVALAILVFDSTNSALWAAYFVALTYLAAMVGGIGLDRLVERFPRRGFLVACAVTQAVLVGLMALPGMPIVVVFVLTLGVGLVRAPASFAQNAATRQALPNDELYLRGQDLRGITTNSVMLVGLSGGGLLVMTAGSSWALAIDAATFVISAIAVRAGLERVRPVRLDVQRDGVVAAARQVFRRPKLRMLLTLSWLVGLAVVPEGLAAPLAAEIGAGSAAVGPLLAADPLGFVIGVYVLSRFVTPKTRLRVMGVLATGSVAVLVLFATQPNLPTALALLALAGAFGGYQITVSATLVTVADDLRGGTFLLARTGLRVAQGIGIVLGGLVAQLVGSAANAVAYAGALGVLIAVPAAVAWARLNRPKRDDSRDRTAARIKPRRTTGDRQPVASEPSSPQPVLVGVGGRHVATARFDFGDEITPPAPPELEDKPTRTDLASAELDATYELAVTGQRRLFQLPTEPVAAAEVGVRTMPISIYLASENNATEVELALVELLDEVEVDIIKTKPPIVDSWFGLMIGRFRRWLTTEQANEIVAKVERAIEVRLLDQPQADVDAKQAEAVARLMTALENQPNACIQVGSIFLLKVDGIMVVRNLSPTELSFLSRNHTVLATPRQVLAALEAFSNAQAPPPTTESINRIAFDEHSNSRHHPNS